MLDFRLKAYQTYLKLPLPAFGPDLTKIDFDHLNYFRRDAKKAVRDWSEVPDQIKETFEKLGVPQAERQYLAGSSAQYESEVVYEKIKEDLARQGVLFMSTDAAVQVVPDLVKKYFGKLVKKPFIGDALRPVEYEDIKRANRLLYATSFLCEGICLLVMGLLFFI